jgi:ANTAR domain
MAMATRTRVSGPLPAEAMGTAKGRPPGLDGWSMARRVGLTRRSTVRPSFGPTRDGGPRCPAFSILRRPCLSRLVYSVRTRDQRIRRVGSYRGRLVQLASRLVLYGANHALQLNQALQSRDLIGQAKGILMERFRVTSSTATTTFGDSISPTRCRTERAAPRGRGFSERRRKQSRRHHSLAGQRGPQDSERPRSGRADAADRYPQPVGDDGVGRSCRVEVEGVDECSATVGKFVGGPPQ